MISDRESYYKFHSCSRDILLTCSPIDVLNTAEKQASG
jgi:hypothetical protein